jgi:hypothetical protein
MQIRRAMTLIELLVSITLGMILIGVSWSTFIMCKDTAARTTTRVELHTTASIYREMFQRDFANASPATACFVRSTPGVPSGSDKVDTVEVVFMRTIHPLRTQMAENIDQQYMADYHWVRWRFRRVWRLVDGVWKAQEHDLYRSHSSPTRRWRTDQTIVGPNNSVFDAGTGTTKPNGGDNNGLDFLNLPRPIRNAAAGIDALDFNRYNTPDAMIKSSDGSNYDIGDLTDLDQNDAVTSSRVMDFFVGWVDASGRSHLVTSDVAGDHRIDGLYMDVTGPSGNAYKSQLGKRPRIMRIGMTLAEGKVTQDFGFSIATPGLAPAFKP